MRKVYVFLFLTFIGIGVNAQVTVFTDDFSTNQNATYTVSGAIGASAWSVTTGGTAGQDYGARRNTSPAQLELTNDATAAANQIGWGFAYTPTASFTAPYTPVLNTNVGVVTWTFNMRQIRTDPGGFVSGSYGVAFVLGGTSTTAATAGNGYAVVLGNTTSVDPIRLVSYTTGLQGSLANIITSNTVGLTDFGQEYLSVRVTYSPTTNIWELFLRDDGALAFVDPATGTLTSQGTMLDATFTGSSLGFMGGYWQGSTGASQTAFFDNTTVTVTYPNTITTGVVTGAPFALANCAATATGTVAFTSTDVFAVGNVFTAQLSDDIGSFAAPVSIGNISGAPAEGTAPSGTINITIPPGTVSGSGYRIRVVSSLPSIIGSLSAAFTITQSGLCGSSNTDYFRSITSGDWGDPTTWESSSDNFATVINPATLAPTFNANTITIRTTHTVTIAAAASADQLTIQSGGILNHSNGVAFTLNNDVSGTDITINNLGIYVLNGTQPTGSGTIDVQSGATVRVDANGAPSESDDFAYGNANVTFRTGSVFDWATTSAPQWSGRIYFSNTEMPTFRFSQTPSLGVGGGTLTIIYGILEANAAVLITGSGFKYLTNGIIGSGNIDASTSGQLIIDGSTAVLGGGTLLLPITPMLIGNGSTATTATMTSGKIITGDVNFANANSKIILGGFDLTVSGSIGGYGPTAYVQTNGTGYLKMNNVTGIRVFPVGFSNLNAMYVNQGGGSDYSVRVENGINPPVLNLTYAINRTWNIFASVPTSGVQVTFWYYTADANPGVIPGTDLMEVLLYSGAAWSITPGNVLITPGGSNPWTVTTITPAGDLTIGTTPVPYIVGKNGGWVLPIDCIISTRAQKRNNNGFISWDVNTCAEVNSFEVQRSVNGGAFQTIGTITPATQLDYNYTDASMAKGTNLYRIKVNRSSGGIKYSNTVAIINDTKGILITALSPNPVSDKATLIITAAKAGAVNFTIFDMTGRSLKQWQTTIAEGSNTIPVNAAELPAGLYHLAATTADSKTITRFVKQ